MDSEIQRWRSIASLASASQSQRMALIPRKKREQVARDRLTLQQEIQKFTDTRHIERPEREKTSALLDRVVEEQKRDIAIVSKNGYLNPSTLNRQLALLSNLNKDLDVSSDSNVSENDEEEKGFDEFVSRLEHYDTVRRRQKAKKKNSSDNTPTLREPPKDVPVSKVEPAGLQRTFLPNSHLNVTKIDQYKTIRAIDDVIVEKGLYHAKQSGAPRLDRLNEHLKTLKKELEETHCADEGPDWTRLQVYGRCFDRIISEFKTYAPLLSEIKKAYDAIINSARIDEDELQFLRGKVQKLLSKNQNRLLLKFEKKKCKRLEEIIEALQNENQKIKEETKRKLILYATYLPETSLEEKKAENPELEELADKIQKYEIGQDPLTVYEIKIQVLNEQLIQKSDQIAKIEKSLELDYVTKSSKIESDNALTEAKEKLSKVMETNQALEQQLKQLNDDIARLDETLKHKETQYLELSKQYTELSEAVALSFDKQIAAHSHDDLQS